MNNRILVLVEMSQNAITVSFSICTNMQDWTWKLFNEGFQLSPLFTEHNENIYGLCVAMPTFMDFDYTMQNTSITEDIGTYISDNLIECDICIVPDDTLGSLHNISDIEGNLPE